MIGKTISHYKILEKLGEGGMGVVYKAEDTKLQRQVALKFLPQEWTRDPDAKARFMNEARAASALQHHNICTIHEIDETEDGQLFICMDFYEGETIREKIERGPLKLDDAIGLAIQIAEGLAKAHQKTIVHRDLKPANVLVTEDGVAKILDFGLAKLAGRSMLTKEGTTLGTAAYMSPEQARGEVVDHRTDIFSLGVFIYEMVTGQLPFKGDYEQALVYSIMNEDPEPLTGLRTGVPMELERTVLKCLEKAPDERYQHADELLVDLRRLQKESKSLATPSGASASKVTSRKRLQSVAIAGILIFIAMIVAAGYFFISREAESKESIRIAVVDFINETHEAELNGLSGMVITALEQSRRLSVLTRSRMFDILKEMGKQDVDHIDEALGREICRQGNVNALVIASIRKFGRLYTIDLKVIDPKQNEHLFTSREEGEGQESIPAMIDKLAKRTRRGLKEKETEIQATSRNVAQVTTPNLEAYQHYFRGEELINKLKVEEAEEEFEKAIAIDTTFALAYYRLAYVRSWFGARGVERVNEPIRKVMQYIEQTPEKERDLIHAYNAIIAGNFDEGIRRYQELLRLYPEEKEALFGIGDYIFHLGDYATAITYLEKVLAMDPAFERAWNHIILACESMHDFDKMLAYATQYVERIAGEDAYWQLGSVHTRRGDFDEARSVFRLALELFPNSSLPVLGIADSYMFENEYEKAEAEITKLLEPTRPLSIQRDGYIGLAVLYAYLGKYRQVLHAYDKVIEIAQKIGDNHALGLGHGEKAFWLVEGWSNVEEAKELGDDIRRLLKDEVDFFVKYPLLNAYMRIGDFERASAVSDLMGVTSFGGLAFSAHAHKAQGNYDAAIESFQTLVQKATLYDDKTLGNYDLAQCYFESGEFDKAIAALRATHKFYGYNLQYYFGNYFAYFRPLVYPKSFYLLGKIYEKTGDRKPAIENYETFLDLWKDADEDLPELIDAKARLLELKERSEE